MPTHRLLGLLVAVLVLVPAVPALAGPVTVDLRVEGPTRTLYEGKVTTDIRPFKFSGSAQTYLCDGTGANGSTTTPSPTRGGALAEAAERTPFELLGSFSAFGPSFAKINGEGVGYDAGTGRYLVEYENGKPASFGGCNDPIVEGDDVLFAYGDGSETPIELTGPPTAKPGTPVTLKAVSAADGTPVPGATVGGQTTGADGTAVVTAPAQPGVAAFKASKPGTIRSNRADVCVTDGADGFCNTTKPGATPVPGPVPPPLAAPDKVAAFAKLAAVGEQQRFAKGRGPRTLQGRVDDDASGVKDVRLRLSRTDGPRCARYDGARERFVTTKACGITRARTFSVGSQTAFSYLLPSALPRGRYVLDVIVVDRAGNQTTTYQRGRNRVVFFVA